MDEVSDIVIGMETFSGLLQTLPDELGDRLFEDDTVGRCR
jgi:hypothetical protein